MAFDKPQPDEIRQELVSGQPRGAALEGAMQAAKAAGEGSVGIAEAQLNVKEGLKAIEGLNVAEPVASLYEQVLNGAQRVLEHKVKVLREKASKAGDARVSHEQ